MVLREWYRMAFAQKLIALAAPARPPRPAVAGHARPLPHLALRGDAAADPGRAPSFRTTSASSRRYPTVRGARARASRSEVLRALERPRLLRARPQPAPRGASRSPQRRLSAHRGRDRRAARRRALDRGGDRRVRLRRARRDPRRQREARAGALSSASPTRSRDAVAARGARCCRSATSRPTRRR